MQQLGGRVDLLARILILGALVFVITGFMVSPEWREVNITLGLILLSASIAVAMKGIGRLLCFETFSYAVLSVALCFVILAGRTEPGRYFFGTMACVPANYLGIDLGSGEVIPSGVIGFPPESILLIRDSQKFPMKAEVAVILGGASEQVHECTYESRIDTSKHSTPTRVKEVFGRLGTGIDFDSLSSEKLTRIFPAAIEISIDSLKALVPQTALMLNGIVDETPLSVGNVASGFWLIKSAPPDSIKA